MKIKNLDEMILIFLELAETVKYLRMHYIVRLIISCNIIGDRISHL